jgi:hypothetical protein
MVVPYRGRMYVAGAGELESFFCFILPVDGGHLGSFWGDARGCPEADAFCGTCCGSFGCATSREGQRGVEIGGVRALLMSLGVWLGASWWLELQIGRNGKLVMVDRHMGFWNY